MTDTTENEALWRAIGQIHKRLDLLEQRMDELMSNLRDVARYDAKLTQGE